VVNNFAPKSTAFAYNGMRARYITAPVKLPTSKDTCQFNHIHPPILRLYLAVLHYNENCGRKQAETKQGEKRYAVVYPKYKKGGHIVRKVTEDSTYGMPIS
jgi:hypothetical protein